MAADEAGPAGDEDEPSHAQYFPRRRSLAGSTSRHVVHQPVSTVSTNSSGNRSARISAASRSWSYSTGTNSTRNSRPASRSAYQTFVRAVVLRPAQHADVDEVPAAGERAGAT